MITAFYVSFVMSRHAAFSIAVREFIIEFQVHNLAFREGERIFTEINIRFAL